MTVKDSFFSKKTYRKIKKTSRDRRVSIFFFTFDMLLIYEIFCEKNSCKFFPQSFSLFQTTDTPWNKSLSPVFTWLTGIPTSNQTSHKSSLHRDKQPMTRLSGISVISCLQKYMSRASRNVLECLQFCCSGEAHPCDIICCVHNFRQILQQDYRKKLPPLIYLLVIFDALFNNSLLTGPFFLGKTL